MLFVGEYTPEEIERAPEFAVADGIIQLANESRGPVDRRWLRVLKMRGADHFTGKHSFAIRASGVEVYPRLEARLPGDVPATEGRAASGIPRLDEMLGGGIPTGDATLALGPSGAGKTVLGLRFVAYGLEQGERCLYISFQEDEQQLLGKAGSFGWDLAGARESGQLVMRHVAPVELDLDAVGTMIRAELLGKESVRRVVIDSLAELQFAAGETDRTPAYVWALGRLLRSAGASAIVTSEIATLGAGTGQPGGGLSFLFHNVLLLRYVELESRMRRALSVLKMRDSGHVKSLVQFDISEAGFTVLDVLEDVAGVLGWSALRSQGESAQGK